MPDGSKRVPTFNTLAREASFRHPQKQGATYKILNQFITPHIESFNALFDDSGLPAGDGDGKGLLSLGLKEIGERVVFDGTDGEGWGNRMRSRSLNSFPTVFLDGNIIVWIEQVTVARPMVPDKDKSARERRVFPSEVRA